MTMIASERAAPTRTYERRIGVAREWLRKRGPGRVTTADLTFGLNWPSGVAPKVLSQLVKQGFVKRIDRGVYQSMIGVGDGPNPPQPAKQAGEPATDPYTIVDLVLGELFPDGIRAIHLPQVIEWRESTKALLKLTEGS